MKRTPELVVVTGAGSGIGRATTELFAANGARVIVADIDFDAAQHTAKLVANDGGVAFPYRVDVSDAGAMELFAEAVRDEHGVPDVVVNNAGFATAGSFLDHTAADWNRIIGVNVLGVVQGSRLFARQMVLRGQGGQIVNVASGAAYMPLPVSTPYCTTKAAVLMASQCLRIELARDGIGVTAVCPGMVNTGFHQVVDHVSVDDNEKRRRRDTVTGVAAIVGSSPEAVARAIVRAVRSNPAILPVTAEARIGYLASRISPSAFRFGARFADADRLLQLGDKLVPEWVANLASKRGA